MRRSEQNCGNCAAFRAVNGGGQKGLGTCRAASPGIMQGMSQTSALTGKMVPVLQGVWPPTKDDEWCMQWTSEKDHHG